MIPWNFHYQMRLMIMARGALVSMIYSKLLRSRVNSVDQSTAFTLMTTDVEKIVDVWWRLLEPWASLLQIIICTYLLYGQLGAICCVPIIVIFCKWKLINAIIIVCVDTHHPLVSFGLVGLAAFKVPQHQEAWFKDIETRVNLTSHTLGSLNSVKLLGLSSKMESTIQKKREDELLTSQKFRVSNCLALAGCTKPSFLPPTFRLVLMSTVAFGPTILTPLISFGAYSITRMLSNESSFSVATAVTSLSIITLITNPAKQLLLAIPMGLQAVGGFDRIQKFLQLAETSPSVPRNSFDDGEKSPVFRENQSMLSSESVGGGEEIAMHRIPSTAQVIGFTPNSITAITGPIGCGKSTILRGLLSEEAQDFWKLAPNDRSIAYCSQTVWIHDGTIRDNIIGESQWDIQRYRDVIFSCDLDVDISRMPEGDATMVGSRGLRLSGGQKQRIVSGTVVLMLAYDGIANNT